MTDDHVVLLERVDGTKVYSHSWGYYIFKGTKESDGIIEVPQNAVSFLTGSGLYQLVEPKPKKRAKAKSKEEPSAEDND